MFHPLVVVKYFIMILMRFYFILVFIISSKYVLNGIYEQRERGKKVSYVCVWNGQKDVKAAIGLAA